MQLGYQTMDISTSVATSQKERALMMTEMQRCNERGKLVDQLKVRVVGRRGRLSCGLHLPLTHAQGRSIFFFLSSSK